MPEGRAFLDAVRHAQEHDAGPPEHRQRQHRGRDRGEFGDVRFTDRTAGSELFINPLMAIYFGFELAALARRSLYLDQLEGTESIFEVSARIEAFRNSVDARPRRAIPH